MDRNGEDTPILVGQTGPLNGHRWKIRSTVTVGRDADCEIMIPNRQVSRHHARIELSPEGVTLEDLSSKNGTHLNGELVQDCVLLRDGDVVQIALAQQFVYLSSDATLPLGDYDQVERHPSRPGKLRLEKRSRQVWIGDEEVIPALSISQYRLLEILSEHDGRVVSRQEVIARVWGEKNAIDVSEQALDALVRRLRDRLATIDPLHPYIVTIRGHGLRLENPPA
ncbi:MAG TPA: FHA domain-containing protein [Anaerolineales bacterium]|nr:FHA domain-containing protein [Anaerolineales bacterium]